MRKETNDIMNRLRSIPLLQNVGSKSQPKDEKVRFVDSWREAMRWCKAVEWESVQLQVNNVMALRVNQSNYTRFQQWNPIVREINTTIAEIVNRQVIPVAKRNELPKRFVDSVSWDLMGICVQIEFSDVCEPIFVLDRVSPWFERGHFPCGWDGPQLEANWVGPMPEGRLVVF